MTQSACRSFLQQMVPKSKGDQVLRICASTYMPQCQQQQTQPGSIFTGDNKEHKEPL